MITTDNNVLQIPFQTVFLNFIETNSNAILGVMEGQNDQELNEGTHKIKKIPITLSFDLLLV